MNITGAEKVRVIVHSVSEDVKKHRVDGEVWQEEGIGKEDHYVVYINDMLDLEDAMEYGTERKGVGSIHAAVTRLGRVVKTAHFGQSVSSAGGRYPSHGW